MFWSKVLPVLVGLATAVGLLVWGLIDGSHIVQVLCAVTIAGSIGGVANALLAYEGFVLPQTIRRNVTVAGENHPVSFSVWQPGFLVAVIMGAVAALVLFGLYGVLRDVVVVGAADPSNKTLINAHLGELAGAVVTGIGGSRLLTAEVDKRTLRHAAAGAAATDANAEAAAVAGAASPVEAFNLLAPGQSADPNPNTTQ